MCSSKYSFKAKKPKLDSEDALELPESVLALLSSAQEPGEPSSPIAGSSHEFEPRVVASISAEIAAALAQAQARIYDDDEEDEDGSSSELDFPDTGIVPITSAIRVQDEVGPVSRPEPVVPLPLQTDDADDEFPITLRTKKDKEPVGIAGLKRKRT